ncbi:MAG: hypothetical protein LAT68_06135 [Cyclobacteriaceae bacterium]|nr:hypothetical protein [Cyclobacteriaceae bacterium]
MTFLLVSSFFELQAQRYSTAAGLRFGADQYGLSVRQRFLPNTNAEGLFTLNQREYRGTLLVAHHFPIFGRGFNFYLGGGGHYGELKDFGATYGVDAQMGVEWKVPATPIIVSAEVKPAYHIQHENWFDLQGAISVHYIILKDTRAQRKKARAKRKRKKERAKRKKERLERRDQYGRLHPIKEFFKKDREQ